MLGDNEFHSLSLPSSAVTGRLTIKAGHQLQLRAANVAAYRLVEGWLASAVTVHNGRRQLAKIYMPGDWVGLFQLHLQSSARAFVALTSSRIEALDENTVRNALSNDSETAIRVLEAAKRDEFRTMEQLAMIGQTDAVGRIARLILDLQKRVGLDLAGEPAPSFEAPLTQIHIGEITGLTNVHVNRKIGELRDEGIVTWKAGVVCIHDQRRLQQLDGLRRSHSLPSKIHHPSI